MGERSGAEMTSGAAPNGEAQKAIELPSHVNFGVDPVHRLVKLTARRGLRIHEDEITLTFTNLKQLMAQILTLEAQNELLFMEKQAQAAALAGKH
jgi:hypothetical protein